MSQTSQRSLPATLDAHRDVVGLAFLIASVAAAWLPLTAFALIGVAELAALVIVLPHAGRLAPVQRTPMSMLGHITAVASGSLICVFFMARYMHYIGFQTHIVPSVLLILELAFLLLLRKPVH